MCSSQMLLSEVFLTAAAAAPWFFQPHLASFGARSVGLRHKNSHAFCQDFQCMYNFSVWLWDFFNGGSYLAIWFAKNQHTYWKAIFCEYNNKCQFVKKCQNLNFKINFLSQEWSESLWFLLEKNDSSGEHFCYKHFLNFIHKIQWFPFSILSCWFFTKNLTNFEPPLKKFHNRTDANKQASIIKLTKFQCVIFLSLTQCEPKYVELGSSRWAGQAIDASLESS